MHVFLKVTFILKWLLPFQDTAPVTDRARTMPSVLISLEITDANAPLITKEKTALRGLLHANQIRVLIMVCAQISIAKSLQILAASVSMGFVEHYAIMVSRNQSIYNALLSLIGLVSKISMLSNNILSMLLNNSIIMKNKFLLFTCSTE